MVQQYVGVIALNLMLNNVTFDDDKVKSFTMLGLIMETGLFAV